MSLTPIADMIAEMLKNCIPWETIILAVRAMERAVSTRHGVDGAAEKRRAWDREYRRRKRVMSADPPDIHPKTPDVGNGALSYLEKEKVHSEVSNKKEKKERGTKLPPDWKPKESHYVEGDKRGMSRADVDERAVRMREWCDANSNRSITTKANWDAAFMGAWLKQEQRNGNRSGGNRTSQASGPPQTGADAVLAGMGRLAARVAERQLAERSGDGAGQHGFDLAGEDDSRRH